MTHTLRALALAILAALCACGGPDVLQVAPGAVDASYGQSEASTALPCAGVSSESPVLLADYEAALALWADVGVDGTGVCVTALRLLGGREALSEACGFPGRPVDGCSHRRTGGIEIGNWLPPARRQAVMVHELGHLLRGSSGHLKCLDVPGDDVMCPSGGPQEPTERDAAFVLARLPDSEQVGYD